MSKILLVEDDPLVARMYRKALSLNDMDVVLAENGQIGIDKAKETNPDLILLDIMMPKMNGMEMLDILKSDAELKKIPVIILTNLSGTHDAELAIKKGALDYLIKSEHKPQEIVVKIKKYLGETGKKADSPNTSSESQVKKKPDTN